ncbi:MAG: type II secretion system GspH family protein [Candidatus Sumerlaea chitinivorans]|nr:type II secretion system GspH family protein [Candidatus Sumerlaea chitinivorans]
MIQHCGNMVTVCRRRRGIKLRRQAAGFMLLEVIISLVILGISVATLMRSFTLSMNAIRRNDVTTQACVLAEGILQDLELNPPTSKLTRGDFSEQGYPNYSWELSFEEEELRYRELQTKTKIKDLKPIRHATLTIYYQTETMRSPYQALEVHLYLPPIERFRFDSKFYNELFREEERR